jgi:hypothetical protein
MDSKPPGGGFAAGGEAAIQGDFQTNQGHHEYHTHMHHGSNNGTLMVLLVLLLHTSCTA